MTHEDRGKLRKIQREQEESFQMMLRERDQIQKLRLLQKAKIMGDNEVFNKNQQVNTSGFKSPNILRSDTFLEPLSGILIEPVSARRKSLVLGSQASIYSMVSERYDS